MGGIYVIKEFGGRVSRGTKIIKAEEFQFVEEASSLIEQAKVQAKEIVAQARLHYEEEKQRGYRDGFREAQKEALQRLIREHKRVDDFLRGIADDLVSVVVTSVRRLIGHLDEETLVESLSKLVLSQMRREKSIELHVPPRHSRAIKKKIKAILAEFPGVDLIDVVDDPALEGSNVIAKSQIGCVEGFLEDYLPVLEESLAIAFKGALAQGLDEGAEKREEEGIRGRKLRDEEVEEALEKTGEEESARDTDWDSRLLHVEEDTEDEDEDDTAEDEDIEEDREEDEDEEHHDDDDDDFEDDDFEDDDEAFRDDEEDEDEDDDAEDEEDRESR